MITCDNARQLFDRYLDGELPPGLQTELHAHRLNCVDCQNALAIMEACGDVIGMDTCEPKPGASFTDRVILANRARRRRRIIRWPKVAVWGGGAMAAAAAIALAVVSLRPAPEPVTPESITAGMTQAQPKPIRDLLMIEKNTPRSEGELRDLNELPEMAAAPVSRSVFDPLSKHAQRILTDAHRATADVGLLLDAGLSRMAEEFVDLSNETADASGTTQDAPFQPGLPVPLDLPAETSGSEPTPEAL